MNTVNADNFNETMKGYIIRACRVIECDDKEVSRLLNGLRWSIDEMTM